MRIELTQCSESVDTVTTTVEFVACTECVVEDDEGRHTSGIFPSCHVSGDLFTDGDETFTASASSYYSPNAEKPYKAFSDLESSSEPCTDTNQWTTCYPLYSTTTGEYEGTYSCCNTSVYGTNIAGEWLQLHSTKKRAVKSFSVTANYGNPSRAPRSFILVCSDDGVTWTLLHAEHAISGWESKQSRMFRVLEEPPQDSYHYFRLIVPSTCGTEGWLTIDKLKFYE